MWDLIVSVPDHCLSFYLLTAPLDLGGPWGLHCRLWQAPSWLPAGLLPGISDRPNIARYWRLLGHKGADKEEGHALWVSFQWPPCEEICLGPHTKIQLCPERLTRADALARPLPMSISWLILKMSVWKWRDPHSRRAGHGAAAPSRDKTC